MEITIEQKIVITYGKGKHWVPETKEVNGITFLKLSALDGGLATFCGVRTALQIKGCKNPWGQNNFLQWVRGFRKTMVDDAILQNMRQRNDTPDMQLPKQFARGKELERVDGVMRLTLPEVAHDGELCEETVARTIATDNREAVYLECTESVVQWIHTAARACTPDPDDDHESPTSKRMRPFASRMQCPPEHKHMVKYFRYDQQSIMCKYVNADGAEKLRSVKCDTWTDDSIAAALEGFATWRRAHHFADKGEGYVLENPPTPPACATTEGEGEYA